MGLKGLAIFAALLVITLAPMAVAAKASDPAVANAFSTSERQSTASPTPGTDSGSGARDYQPQPHITVANPPPTVLPWTLHEQIAWGANLVLVLLGYAGIMMAVSLLKKIDRQTGYAEVAAEAAATSAQAALLNAQAFIQAERPWILITVEPSRSTENSFSVVATNRGRTPARIIETMEQTMIAVKESHLPIPPEYDNQERSTTPAPIILLPGEFTTIGTFCRNDVKGLCDSEERFKRIETWEEKIYLYGQVLYRDLIAPADSQARETNWCCWYIHGRQNSGLVLAGPPEYNSHT
jgi:hypothetical protein